MSDCDGPVDLTEDGIAVEASMWFDAKLKADTTATATEVRFADDLGFESVSVGDKIVTYKSRTPEMMVVVSVNESSKSVVVTRGQGGTTARAWPKGTQLSVFRFMDEAASVESVFETSEGLDGTVAEVLVDTLLVFDWEASYTAMPGCYWVEFKVIKVVPGAGGGVVTWAKRVPLSSQGFMVRVIDSPTSP